MQEPAPSPATSRELSVGSIVTTTCHNFPQELLVIQRMQSSRPHLICVALGHDEDDLAVLNDFDVHTIDEELVEATTLPLRIRLVLGFTFL